MKGRRPEVFCSQKFLKNSQENSCAGASFSVTLEAATLQLYLKETPAQLLPLEFSEVVKNSYFEESLGTVASIYASY